MGTATTDLLAQIGRAEEAFTVRRVFGEPYEKDGVTVIPAAHVQGAAGGGGGEAPAGEGSGTGTGFEGWRRSGTIAYGLTGDFNALRVDRPYAADIELRRHYSNPHLLAALNGPMPYTESGRLRYALTLFAGEEHRTDEFRGLVRNTAGESSSSATTTATASGHSRS